MKVMFLFQGTPHYYNYVLNRLNAFNGIEVVNVVPSNPVNIGQGVFQSRQDIVYSLCELDEYRPFYGGFFLRSLWKLLLKQRPDIVVTSDAHLRGFVYNLPTLLMMKLLRVRLILKSIPFRVSTYEKVRQGFKDRLKESQGRPSPRLTSVTSTLPFSRLPASILLHRATTVISDTYRRLAYIWRLARLLEKKLFWRLPDAHVNYIPEAVSIYGSFGVCRERIFVTYNSPDTDRLLAARDTVLKELGQTQPHPHRIIHVGRLVQWKRVDLLLAALARLKATYHDAELLVIGAGPQDVELRDLAAVMGLQDEVQFLGGVYDPLQLGRYLMSSSIYVLAGMGGLSINEAMCFGMPIICSVCDGTERSLVKDGVNGLYFREGDAKDLCEKIDYIFAHPELRVQMGRNSLQIIRNEINIQTVIRGYIRAFEYVTGRRLAMSSA